MAHPMPRLFKPDRGEPELWHAPRPLVPTLLRAAKSLVWQHHVVLNRKGMMIAGQGRRTFGEHDRAQYGN